MKRKSNTISLHLKKEASIINWLCGEACSVLGSPDDGMAIYCRPNTAFALCLELTRCFLVVLSCYTIVRDYFSLIQWSHLNLSATVNSSARARFAAYMHNISTLHRHTNTNIVSAPQTHTSAPLLAKRRGNPESERSLLCICIGFHHHCYIYFGLKLFWDCRNFLPWAPI